MHGGLGIAAGEHHVLRSDRLDLGGEGGGLVGGFLGRQVGIPEDLRVVRLELAHVQQSQGDGAQSVDKNLMAGFTQGIARVLIGMYVGEDVDHLHFHHQFL